MKTKLMLRIIIAILMTGGLIGLNSCMDDGWDFSKISDEILLTPGIAAPIAYGELSLKDILIEFDSAGYIQEYEDSLMYISYAQDMFSYPSYDIMSIPDQDFLEFFIEAEVAIFPFWNDLPLGDTVSFDKNQDGSFEFPNGEKLDSIYVKSGDLQINVSSSFLHSGIINIGSDSLLHDGEPFHDILKISSADGSFDTSYTVNLENYKIYLDNSDPVKSYLPLTFELSLINSGSPINLSESCNISLSFINFEFSSAYGFFGNYDLMVEDGEIVLELFDISEIEGQISFFNPQLVLNVNNSYGLPVQIDLSDFSTYSVANNVTTPLVFDGVNPFDILAPGIDSVGTSVPTRIEINNTNCNIAEALETFPNRFNYSVSAITNPLGPEDTDNFITDSSSLDVGIEVALPLHFKANGYALEDTILFDFEEQFGDNVDLIETFILDMDVKNGLPMEVNMQLFFKDENYNMLDSMFVDDKFLLPPTINAQNQITEPSENTKSIELDSAKLEKIKTTKYMFIRATISTAGAQDGDYVKFYSYYNIYFKLKLDAALNVNSRDL